MLIWAVCCIRVHTCRQSGITTTEDSTSNKKAKPPGGSEAKGIIKNSVAAKAAALQAKDPAITTAGMAEDKDNTVGAYQPVGWVPGDA